MAIAVVQSFRMNLIWRLLAVTVSFMWAVEIQATKIACVGSNGERFLAQTSLVEPKGRQLEAELQKIAQVTKSKLDKSQISQGNGVLSVDEFHLGGDSFEVELAQVHGSNLVGP